MCFLVKLRGEIQTPPPTLPIFGYWISLNHPQEELCPKKDVLNPKKTCEIVPTSSKRWCFFLTPWVAYWLVVAPQHPIHCRHPHGCTWSHVTRPCHRCWHSRCYRTGSSCLQINKIPAFSGMVIKPPNSSYRWWFQAFLSFLPLPNEMIQFDFRIFFQRGWLKPPTTGR